MSQKGQPQRVDDLHPLARQVLEVHPVLDTDTDRLENGFADQLHDPFLFADMQKVVDRIVQAIQDGEKIVVFADFDTDGIPAAAGLADMFTEAGHQNVDIYIPKRDIEGFGLKEGQVENFVGDDTNLLITVDCGIRSHKAVSAARAAGVDVIILDHHVPAETTPDANHIINPALDSSEYPFADLCGAGVVFKLLQAVAQDGRIDLPTNFVKGQLDMAAIGTISDMVPLVGENHVLAKYGLKMLRHTTRPGLRELYEQGRIQGHELTATDVGFTIGSHINAASRLDQPALAYRLLTTRNQRAGRQLAKKLHSVYRKRKRKTANLKQAVAEAIAGVDEKAVVSGSQDWKPALLGPVAHTVADKTARPTFLWGQANGTVKGSARATRHNVVSMLQAVGDKHLAGYGGHELAGGFELAGVPGPDFSQSLSDVAGQYQVDEEDAISPVPASIADMDWPLYQSLSALGPYGVGCPQPLFRFSGVTVTDRRQFGSGGDHITLTLEGEKNQIEAAAFFADTNVKAASVGDRLSLTGALEKTTFGFQRKLRLRIEDVSSD